MLNPGDTVILNVSGSDGNPSAGDLSSRLTAELGNNAALTVNGINISVGGGIWSSLEMFAGLNAAGIDPGTFGGTITFGVVAPLGSSQDVANMVAIAIQNVTGNPPYQVTIASAPDQTSTVGTVTSTINQAATDVGTALTNITGTLKSATSGIQSAVGSTGTALSILPWLVLAAGVAVVVILLSGRKTNLTALLR